MLEDRLQERENELKIIKEVRVVTYGLGKELLAGDYEEAEDTDERAQSERGEYG